MLGKRKIRKLAFELVFERESHPELSAEEVYANARTIRDLEDDEESSVAALFYGVENAKTEIDETIAKASQRWNVNRISGVSMAIMRIAVYEMMIAKTVVPPIAINEAVELAKTFAEDGAHTFVNGVLNHIKDELPGD